MPRTDSPLAGPRTPSPPATAAVMVAAIVVGYAALLRIESLDAHWWFIPWLNHIVDHGIRQTLAIDLPVLVAEANNAGNYAPPYLYLLYAGSPLSPEIGPLMVVKLVSVTGALFCAGAVFFLLRHSLDRGRAALGALGYLLLPSVVLNAAGWGQIEAYYAGFVVLAVAFALRGQRIACMVVFGMAISIKIQAAFIGPFLLFTVLDGARTPRRAWTPLALLALPVAVYAAMMLPAWLAGRPALELATIYPQQARAYPWLSMNVPNPWTFVQYLHLLSQPVGLVLGLGLGAAAGLAITATALTGRFRGVDGLLVALVSVTLLPYVLPKMADRYFYMADVLSYVLALVQTRRWTVAVAVAIQIGSFGAYLTHFSGYRVGTGLGVVAVTVAVAILVSKMIERVRDPRAGHAFAV